MAILHPVHKRAALTPKYVERFHCVGPECEDNCCTGWKVTIDKKTFNAYRKVEHPDLRSRLKDDVKRIRSNESQEAFARIELKPESRECPMMENRLCSIQRELGEDKLSNTCFSYPRYTRQFGGFHEQSLTLSCPEAARLALLQPDAFDFVETQVLLRDEMSTSVAPKHGLTPEGMSEVRMFSFQLMRSQGLELWQKLAVLGVFCERLDSLLKQGGAADVVQLVGTVEAMVTQGLVVNALSELAPDYDVQAAAFAQLWGVKNPTQGLQTPQDGIQHAIARGLGANMGEGPVDRSLLIAQYTKGVQRLPQALQAAPWLMENYLLNEMFRELFPFGAASVYDHYIRLVTRFGLVRLMMAAQCTTDGDLPTPETLARTVQVFCRRYQHDELYASKVAAALKNSGWDALERIFRFLKS
jgi:lysine-N-methylase